MGNSLKTYMVLRGNNGNRDEYGGDVESRFRDRRRREHYDNGRFAPMRSAYDGDGARGEMYPMSRYDGGIDDRYTRTRSEYGGRTRNEYGGRMENRYMPTRSAYDWPEMGYVEPVRMTDEREGRRSWKIIENNGGGYIEAHHDPRYEPPYEPEYNPDGMRRVMGFGGSSYVERPYKDEMSYRSGEKIPGHAAAKVAPIFTYDMAEEWMSNLHNDDGTKGPHWTLEDVKTLMKQKGITGDPVRVWVAMNAEYSDMVMTNRKHGIDKPEYYLDAALSRWINDKDAVSDKEAAYFTYVVKH